MSIATYHTSNTVSSSLSVRCTPASLRHASCTTLAGVGLRPCHGIVPRKYRPRISATRMKLGVKPRAICYPCKLY
ncbi:hypothetical protein ACHAWF_005408 [Thalassiosira exigua]